LTGKEIWSRWGSRGPYCSFLFLFLYRFFSSLTYSILISLWVWEKDYKEN